ncbi:MAG: ribosomal protein S27AE [Pseudomonadales bacterium]|jgi:ribosomal protein S27AE
MSNEVDSNAECSNCGEKLFFDMAKDSQPCPICGSKHRTISLSISEELKLDIKESLRTKSKDTSFNNKKNPRCSGQVILDIE